MKLGKYLVSISRLSLYSSPPIKSHGFPKISIWNLFITRQRSDSTVNVLRPDYPTTTNRRLDHDPSASLGMWSYPTNPEHCCIYRVPDRLRRINPEAYTPQLVLIGPIHHYLKSQALEESRGDIINTKSMGYLNMEKYKKIYLAEFAQKFEDKNTIDGFRGLIKANEEMIRASYSESTSWIKSLDFVEMILLDSVFILEHMLRVKDAKLRTEKTWDDDDVVAHYKGWRTKKTRDDAHAYYEGSKTEKTGDLIVDDPSLQISVKEHDAVGKP